MVFLDFCFESSENHDQTRGSEKYNEYLLADPKDAILRISNRSATRVYSHPSRERDS